VYNSLRKIAERLLRIPHDPTPPPGDHVSTRIFLAAPNYYKYLLCLWGLKGIAAFLGVTIAVVIPSAALAITLTKQGKTWAILLWLIPVAAILLTIAGILLLLAILRLDFDKRWYVVTDRSLRIREGVTTVREMTVNFANIQNISISQGPLQRALQIADLRVDTAGGGGGGSPGKERSENLHTAWFRGINNADEVRELIQQRLRRLKDSGLGDHEENAPNVPSAKLEFSVAMLAAIREIHTEAAALRQTVDR
jgi:membrane protein YdbS with pleckstrin-like domain